MAELVTLRDGTKTEVDFGINRLAKAIENALVNVPVGKVISTYELAEILVSAHHHNRGDLMFIDAVEGDLK